MIEKQEKHLARALPHHDRGMKYNASKKYVAFMTNEGDTPWVVAQTAQFALVVSILHVVFVRGNSSEKLPLAATRSSRGRVTTSHLP